MIVWGGHYYADVGCGSLADAEWETGNCCVANGTPGCTDPVCEQIICDVDPYCCDVLWDQICADAASADPTCAASCWLASVSSSSRTRGSVCSRHQAGSRLRLERKSAAIAKLSAPTLPGSD